MLPSELLVAVFSKNGTVHVKYAKYDCSVTAYDLIGIFSQSVGKKRKNLNEALESYLEQHFNVDARRVRGLFELLLRRCTFSSEFSSELSPELSPEEPQPFEIRKKVFEHAKYAASEEERKAAVEAVAKELGIDVDHLLSRMFADMEDEQVMAKFDAVGLDANTLVKQYNLSLVQTLLFRASEMEFSVSANAREVFSNLKRLGLMYHAYTQTDRMYVKVDGPMSVLKLTEKYGTSFAKLLPAIVKSDDFYLKAYVIRRKGDVRQYVLNLDAKHKWFFSFTSPSQALSSVQVQAPAHQKQHETYDSSIEERFASDFKSFSTGWTLRREPCALIAGTGVIIPDFILEKGGLKLYMEIVGFWTEDYLKKKIEKLSAVKERIIVAVGETLACSKLKEKFKENENIDLIYFKNRIPADKIVKILKGYENAAVQEELRKLKAEQPIAGAGDEAVEKPKTISGDVVRVEAAAEQLSISPEAARMIQFEGYRLLGDEFISLEKIKRIKEKFDRLGEQVAYSKACEIIRGEGIKCADSVLLALNFKVEWKNLQEKDATVLLSSRA